MLSLQKKFDNSASKWSKLWSKTDLVRKELIIATSKTSRSDQHRAELDAAEAFDAAVVTSDVLSVEFCSKYSGNVASAVPGDDDLDSARNKTRYNTANWLLHLSPHSCDMPSFSRKLAPVEVAVGKDETSTAALVTRAPQLGPTASPVNTRRARSLAGEEGCASEPRRISPFFGTVKVTPH